jgi:uncharacterized membrane protein
VEAAHPLAAWESYYVIVGTSGAALIGMQFVVMTLIADRRNIAAGDTIRAFGSPTVVHLTLALVISAVMSAPWTTMITAGIIMLFCGLSGLTYAGIVIRRTRTQTGYVPVWQDWVWYAILPSIAYLALSVSAWLVNTETEAALFTIAGVALVLILIGVHNAWDSITHIVTGAAEEEAAKIPDAAPKS